MRACGTFRLKCLFPLSGPERSRPFTVLALSLSAIQISAP